MRKEQLLKNDNLLTKYNALINLMYTSSNDKNISYEFSCNKKIINFINIFHANCYLQVKSK